MDDGRTTGLRGVGSTPIAWYVYGLGLLWKVTADGTPYFYHFDGDGNTVALSNATAGVDALFAAHVSSFQGQTAAPGGPVASGAYLYLQEHIRLNGISPFFKTGIPHRAGGCAAWTGSYQNGLRWLGMQRGRIGIMLTSNSLSEGQLVTYARSQFCK